MVSGKEESVFDKGKWKEYSYTFYINLAIPLRRVFISINLSDGLQVFETCPLTRKISSLILYVASPSRKGEDNDIILENSIRSVLSEFSFGERRVGNFLNSSAGSLCATGWIFDEVRRGTLRFIMLSVFFFFSFLFFLTSLRGIIRINSGKSCLKPRFEQGNFVCLSFIIIRIAARTKCCNWIFSFFFLSLLLPLFLFLSLKCSINIPPGVAWSLIEKWKIGRDWWWSDYQLDVQINPAKSRYKS